MTTELNPALKLGDLIEQLESEIDRYEISTSEALARAYAAGADQELLACGNYLEKCAAWEPEDVTELYNYRRPRPKPPSLKEQALDRCNDYIDPEGIIRRALESLPN